MYTYKKYIVIVNLIFVYNKYNTNMQMKNIFINVIGLNSQKLKISLTSLLQTTFTNYYSFTTDLFTDSLAILPIVSHG